MRERDDGDGDSQPGDENRRGERGRDGPDGEPAGRAACGSLGGESEKCDASATPRGRRQSGGSGKGGGGQPHPRRSHLACARQHGTVPTGYPPADSRPHGVEPGGEARASPPSRPSLSLGPRRRLRRRLSLSPAAAAPHRAARPRQGRAPTQRLVPGAGSYGALPESAFRGTKALRGNEDDEKPTGTPQGKRVEAAEGNASLAEHPTTGPSPPATGRATAAAADRGQRTCEATPAAPPGTAPPDGD